MNMISTGAFLTEVDHPEKQTVANKFVSVWEKRNAKAARAGGASLMALSLAACGSSSTTTTSSSSDSSSTTTTTTTTPVSSSLTIANDDIDGTSGNDTVTGARIDTVQAWNSADTIDLGAGTDTFSATINANVTPASMTGVENVTITALGNVTVDMDNATGVENITSQGSTNTLLVDDIQGVPTSITVNNSSAAQSFRVKDAQLTGSSDAITINLNGAGAVVNVGAETDTDGDFETITINASGGASDLGAGGGFGADATSITVTATAALDLGSGDQFAKATTFDASASTKAVTVHFADRASAGETAVSWSFGAGADQVDIDAITLANFGDIAVDLGAGDDRLIVGSKQDTDTGSSFNGGDGTDILNVGGTAITSTAFEANLSNFEVLEINATANFTQDMDLTGGISTVSIAQQAVANDVTLNDAMDDLVVNLNGTALAATDTGDATTEEDMADVKINLKTDTASDSVTLNMNATGGDVNIISFDPDTQYETVTVTSSGTAENTIQTIGTAINNMIFTGSTAIELISTGAMTGVADFSAMTGAVTTTTAANKAITVLGGSGDDSLTTGAADNVAQTIKGGAGDDTITAGAIIGETTGINYTFNGEAGSDTITTAAAVGDTSADGLDAIFSINGGDGLDFITLGTDADISHDVVSTATGVADADEITGFESGTSGNDDDFDYNGTVKNDSATTITAVSNATLAGGLAADADATVYIVSTALTGAAATTMAALVAESTVAGITADYATFESALSTALGTVTGLDNVLSADETVLLNVDDGTNSVILKVTNTDTTTANTLTAAELDLVAVMVAADDLVTADFI